MEFNILKKRFDIGRKIDNFLDKVSESGVLFTHGMDAYSKGINDSFIKKIEDITNIEHQGDALPRDLEEQLYTRTLIPESPGGCTGTVGKHGRPARPIQRSSVAVRNRAAGYFTM